MRPKHVRLWKEISVGRARAERSDADCGVLQFDGDCLAPGEDECLRSMVSRQQRSGLEPCDGRHIQDAPATTLHHRTKKKLRQAKDRFNVQPENRQVILDWLLPPLAAKAVASVVDQNIHVCALAR